MDKLVSIIMPVHNAAKYLNESISSVLLQTYLNWELLIVDDCSTDDSFSIITRYVVQDTRIRSFKTLSPSGSPTLPRNIGVEHAQGRYIAFLDSDDAWMPDKLEKQLKLFEDEQVAIVFSDYEKMSEEGERNNRVVRAPREVDYKHLLRSNVIGCLTVIYDTEKVGTMFFPHHAHEDYILWLSILKKGYVARNTGTVEALYRVCLSSVSSNKMRVLFWQWDIYRSVEKVGFLKSVYYFLHYAYKAYKKSRI